ncbi:MAG: ribonuclease III [Bacteroidales bacterium]|nr:ribonuclease III [Bacteroidales bacterium]
MRKKIFSGISEDRELNLAIRNIFGFIPENIFLYKLAFRHRSAPIEVNFGIKVSNERLEYLGDAILGAIVADYLFKKFPLKDEGFLTEMRSKIVNREQLNKLIVKLGLERFIQFSNDQASMPKNLYGDVLEAFIGALYIDRGYDLCKKVVINRIIKVHYDVDDLISAQHNYKSRLLEWSQQEKKKLEFKVSDIPYKSNIKQYKVEIFIDEEPYASAIDFTIKGAEKLAAGKTWEMLEK